MRVDSTPVQYGTVAVVFHFTMVPLRHGRGLGKARRQAMKAGALGVLFTLQVSSDSGIFT